MSCLACLLRPTSTQSATCPSVAIAITHFTWQTGLTDRIMYRRITYLFIIIFFYPLSFFVYFALYQDKRSLSSFFYFPLFASIVLYLYISFLQYLSIYLLSIYIYIYSIQSYSYIPYHTFHTNPSILLSRLSQYPVATPVVVVFV